jgi:predicted transcriptional regulator
MPNDNHVVSDGTPALPAGVPATAASNAVWTALMANSDTTAVELAEHANVGKSTANKVLAALETAGAAVRQPGGRAGGRSLPDRWRAASDQATEDAEPAASVQVAEAPDSSPDQAKPQLYPVATNGRLARGQLREMVLAHLRQHPGQKFSPTGLCRALDRSAGAIANACERLVTDGIAVRTSDRPRRYQIARRGRR